MADFWNGDGSEDEYDEYEQNEVPPADVDEEFENTVLDVKHKLYENIILGPKLGTKEAQSLETLQDYLNNINHVYILSLNAQKGQVNENELNRFPENVREPLRKLLNWMADYFKKNRAPDTIPYEDYIRKSFKEYQFVQDKSFE